MIKNNQLYIFSLVFFFTHCFFLLYGNNIIKVSGNDTLLACLIGTILDIILFLFSKKFIYKKIKPSYLLIPIIIFFTIILLKDTALFIKSNFLREGNLFYLILLLILTSLLISKRELNQIAHLAFISLLIFFFLFLIQVTGATHAIDTSYLDSNFTSSNIIKGALLFSCYTYLPFLLGPSFLLSKYYDYPYMLVMNKISSFLIFNRFYAIFNIFLILDSTIVLVCLFSFLKGFIKEFKTSFN